MVDWLKKYLIQLSKYYKIEILTYTIIYILNSHEMEKIIGLPERNIINSNMWKFKSQFLIKTYSI